MCETLAEWLWKFVESHGGVSGTVHLLKDSKLALEDRVVPSPLLHLAAVWNIPESVSKVIEWIPRGKGMAGLAWERNEAVSTCNLQTDRSGDVRPGARAVKAQAAVALPIHDEQRRLRGVVGIAFAEDREIDAEELARLNQQAEALP